MSDVSGDGFPDILTGIDGSPGSAVGVLLNQKNGTFAAAVSFGGSTNVSDLATADVNKDGRIDILVADLGNSSLDVRLNTATFLSAAPAAFFQPHTSIFPNPAAGTATLSATGLSADGRQLEVTLTDAVGRATKHLKFPIRHGAVQALLPTAELAPGLYWVHATARDEQGAAVGALPVQRVSVQ